ncbi:fibronectin type III-like domain-containing protein [Hirsutella rhossiliensis]|uniref:beta-glucosidase n=1 Tax=Hirsutella rhossiliensis TaxID=111463 RepID=A0A9P8N8Y7_9HYPO|nr:fibronectin type III-like domain-containing protein [Hirsutella rhossiliensis]KAH0967919.1 fibronectin type III-like domain-containing protein [Hirsutella rhossiliensis]
MGLAMAPAAVLALAVRVCAAAAALANPVFSQGIETRAELRSPGYYPAPYGGWADDWVESYAKARKLVDAMTLAEKTNITSGTGIFMGARCTGNTGSVPRLGFPQLCLNDGQNGVRQADHVTVFPDAITAGATFDKQLLRRRAEAIGDEARTKGVNVWLGPTVGPMGRKPKGGRNWEGFGADPVLQAVGARETIRGVQSRGVIATIKHFIGNEQEMYRMYNPIQRAYSSNIDDRVLHELYMWPFAEGIRAGVGSVMMAYNAVNGSASSQNALLINGLVKDELGLQGFVMTDWLGHMSGVASALAGLDMDMPGDTQVPLVGASYWMGELTRAVLNGSVPVDRLNDMATRIVAAWYRMGQDQPSRFPATNFDTNTRHREGLLYPGAWPDSPIGVVNHFVPAQADHDVVARNVARDAITLLKNEGGLLPLSPVAQALRVFGTGAQANPDGPNACADRNCNKGTLGQGWGSGTVDYMYLDDPISALRSRARNVVFHNSDLFPPVVDEPGKDDVAIVFVTSDAGENTYIVEGNHGDRDASGLYVWHGGDRLVQEAAKRYNNVVVVIHTVGPVLLERWVDLPSVKSVLIAHLPGQEAGRSLTDVLFGDVSPSGHLPYSITRREEDLPWSVTDLVGWAGLKQPQDPYSEGLYIDYRYLNKKGIKSRYAFGHGLSYTSFAYTNATIAIVTPLTPTPPPRAPKRGILDYSQSMPAPAEAVQPSGFHTHWRYLYSWLSNSAAESAVRDAATRKYPYPDGYSTEQRPGPRAGGGQGGNPALWDVAYKLSVRVTNIGTRRSGKASVQAYLQFPDKTGYEMPVIQLRDFEKTKQLAPGESTTDWVVPAVDGAYRVWLGAASDDLTTVCRVDGLVCNDGVKGPV